jgi:microcystin-dependent protein
MNVKILITGILLLWSSIAGAQGVIPLALAQQSDINGRPLNGALLYIYQVGTVATPQDAFQDFGLTIKWPWPLMTDSTGRIPMFYLADGQVHVRLTDSAGTVILDYPNLQVVGPSGGGGGPSGGGVDPTTVAAVGDVKFRINANEVITGWVRLNGQTVGTAGSGANHSGTTFQALYIYVYNNCSNAHCPVPLGRGATALADFNAGKVLTLPDWRGRTPFGLDDMGAAAAGRIPTSSVTSGGGDTSRTAGASGGAGNHVMAVAELAAHSHPITDPGHTHTFGTASAFQNQPGGGGITGAGTAFTTSRSTIGVAATDSVGSSSAFNTMPPFILGTWYIKQ